MDISHQQTSFMESKTDSKLDNKLTLENLEAFTEDFAKKHIAPYTKLVDSEGRFPREAFEAMKKAGFLSLFVPKEYGGLAGKMSDYIKICYIFAKYCPTTALCFTMHSGGVVSVATFGNKALKDLVLPQVVRGEKVIAIAFRESGSHFGISMSEKIGRAHV